MFSDEEIIAFYAHGDLEQFHTEIKDNMDIERLHLWKFDANELFLELVIISNSILRMSSQGPRTKQVK